MNQPFGGPAAGPARGPEAAGAPLLLVLSQVYPPDPAALGQHLHDVAREMARRGHRVRVLTSARGYTDPRQRFPRREQVDGVDVRRLAWGSIGKASLRARALGGIAFLVQACARALLGPRPTGVLVGTSPPMAPAAGRLLAALRRAPLTLWLMDINPDQAILSGAVAPGALSARLLDRANAAAVRGSRAVVVLDRFMEERVRIRWDGRGNLAVVPAWAHQDHVSPVAHSENPFRTRHGWDGRRVVMYSGNLSPVHPLDTMLQAARELRDDPRLLLVFVGGGGQRAQVEEAIRRDRLDNVELLPYQPLAELRYSLSAADVHLVSLGATMVGIVHPSKIYGAMAAARPILYLGPARSHAGSLVERFDLGWQVEHGDVPGAVAALREIATCPTDLLEERGRRALAALEAELPQARLVSAFCDLVERGPSEATAG
jgi:glycosyltransferase involved in cell wall biosynthesis